MSGPLSLVRDTTARVVEMSTHVTIDHDALHKEIHERPHLYTKENAPLDWAQNYHYCNRESPQQTAQYILVLDCLNFCFWPCEGYEYAQLAGSLKHTLTNTPTAFEASNLSRVTEAEVSAWLQPPPDFPLPTQEQKSDEKLSKRSKLNVENKSNAPDTQCTIPLLTQRTRVLRELGNALLSGFEGKASKMIEAAGGSAAKLVDIVTSSLPAFRDHAIFKGEQVFFYKRAQIFTADVYLAFDGKGLGAFGDISELTCFADYRLPQLMYHLGILKYDKPLQEKVSARQEIIAGSEEELEIRAATVQVVEMMCSEVRKLTRSPLLSLNLDNILWERGESQLDILPPHHRTMTVYY